MQFLGILTIFYKPYHCSTSCSYSCTITWRYCSGLLTLNRTTTYVSVYSSNLISGDPLGFNGDNCRPTKATRLNLAGALSSVSLWCTERHSMMLGRFNRTILHCWILEFWMLKRHTIARRAHIGRAYCHWGYINMDGTALESYSCFTEHKP